MPASAWSFDRALRFWRDARIDPASDYDRLESAEAFLLDHHPADLEEAVGMLEVIYGQDGDTRSDGRDHDALARIIDRLKRPAEAHLIRQALTG